jgi:hypothetical protein
MWIGTPKRLIRTFLTLEEEKQTDLKLTEVTEQHIMPAAMGVAPEEPAGGKKPAPAHGKAA